MKRFDYSDFTKYYNNFRKMSSDFDAWITNFLLLEGMRFIATVKPLTPVDTGDLRNHWELDTPSITRVGDTLHVWFVNSMNYATFVEYGHAKPYKSGAGEGSKDWVDGYFMMTVSLDKIERSMPKRFDASFKSFLNKLGVL